MLTIRVSPMGAVRMTRRGKFTNESAQRYLRYKDDIGYQIKGIVEVPATKAVGVNAIFYMPIPESWSQKKKKAAVGQYVTKKPDVDNLVKGLFDAANGILWADDNLVAKCSAVKIYSDDPRIEIEYGELIS